eukprot:Skav203829  [mRNA]  locus=scaffold1652:32699:38219:+ [translate_table: standard]
MEAQQPQNRGWKCTPCSQQGSPGWNGKAAIFCQFCGKHWQKVCWEDVWGWDRPQKESRGKERSWSARAKEGKKKEKGKEKKKPKDKDGQNPKDAKSELTFSPFEKFPSGAGASPWTTPPSMSPFPPSQPASSSQNAHQQELVKALMECYPDSNTMPPHVRELVEKSNVDSAKALTRAMHTATTALGKAKQSHLDLVEAKKTHRSNWLRHLKASVLLWNQQLEEYRKRQGELQDSVAKSAKAVESARRQIQLLNSGESSTAALLALEETNNTDEGPVDLTQDTEEEDLRLQVHQALTACEQSLGPVPSLPQVPPTQLESDGESDDGQDRRGIEAYNVGVDQPCAACPVRKLCFSTEYALKHFCHSICDAPDFLPPDSAVRAAWALQWEVLSFLDKDCFDVPGESLLFGSLAAEGPTPSFVLEGDATSWMQAASFPVVLFTVLESWGYTTLSQLPPHVSLREIGLNFERSVEDVLMVHPVACALPGIPRNKDAFIVEYVGDVAPGTFRRLIICDVCLYSTTPSQGSAPDKTIRKVISVDSVMLRSAMLSAGHVRAFCEALGDGCLVYHNLVPWLSQRNLVREMNHGDYVAIHIPPVESSSSAIAAVCAYDSAFVDPDDAYSHVVSPTGSGGTSPQPSDADEDDDELLDDIEEDGSTTAEGCDSCRDFATWFVDHRSGYGSHLPRIVRLCGAQDTWRDALCHAWPDRMIRTLPFRITVVHAQPASLDFPHGRYHQELTHIVIEQHMELYKGAVIVAWPDLAVPGRPWQLQAYSMPALLTLGGQMVLRRVGAPPFIYDQPTSVWLGPLRLRDYDVETASEFTGRTAYQLLAETWDLEAQEQAANEPRSAVFATYYLHGQNFPRCEEERRVRLGSDELEWFPTISRIWADRLDPLRARFYFMVSPRPAGLAEEGVAGALLIVQSPPDLFVALHMSTQFDGGVWRRFAFFSRPHHNMCSLILVSQMAPLCFRPSLQMTCEASIGDVLLDRSSRVDVVSGRSASVLVRPMALSPSLPITNSGSGRFVEVLREAIEPVQELFDTAWVPIHTWFLHHENHLRCLEPRLLPLGADSADWETQARALWADRLEFDCPLDAFLIQPQPRDRMSLPTSVHVLLSQRHEGVNPRVGIMLSVEKNYDLKYFAVSSMPTVTPGNFLFYGDVLEDCGPGPPAFDCSVWFGSQRLRPDRRVAPDHGMHFTIWALPYSEVPVPFSNRPQEPIEEGDDPSFLQVAKPRLRFDLSGVFRAFEIFDTHLFLPCYDLPFGACDRLRNSGWLDTWWTPGTPFDRLHIYFDGAFGRADSTAGSATAAFVHTAQGWEFAGALSTKIEFPCDAYMAEQFSAFLAVKFSYDILKFGAVSSHCSPEVVFCYDNETVGHQLDGSWQARRHPLAGQGLRDIMYLLEAVFKLRPACVHVRGHSGIPGNDLVDFLAVEARQGRALFELSSFLQEWTSAERVGHLHWMWCLFDEAFVIDFEAQELLLPAEASTTPSIGYTV